MTIFLALFGLGLPEMFILSCGLLFVAFWMWMIVDCIQQETDPTTKIAWLLVILLVGLFGAPLYLFVRKLPRTAQSPTFNQQ